MEVDRPEPIAVIGYGYRLPGGMKTDDEFWSFLAERGVVQEPVENRYGKQQAPYDGFKTPMRVASLYEGLLQDGAEHEFDCTLLHLPERRS